MHWKISKMLGRILFITISLSLGVNGFIIANSGRGCEDKCLDDCQEATCNITYFAQFSPCSYGCIVNDQYTYHTEPDFQSCGTDKVCYQGQCVLSDSTYECQNVYGEDYISVEVQWNPCTYLCVPTSGCGDVYSEDKHNGCTCVAGYTQTLGRCRSGICISDQAPLDPYYPIGPYFEGGMSSIRATAENAATPRGYVSFPEAVAISNGITTFSPYGSLSGFLKSTPRVPSSEDPAYALNRPLGGSATAIGVASASGGRYGSATAAGVASASGGRYGSGTAAGVASASGGRRGSATAAGVASASGYKYGSATAAAISSASRNNYGSSASGGGFAAVDRSTSGTGIVDRRDPAGRIGVGSTGSIRGAGSVAASVAVAGSLGASGAAAGSLAAAASAAGRLRAAGGIDGSLGAAGALAGSLAASGAAAGSIGGSLGAAGALAGSAAASGAAAGGIGGSLSGSGAAAGSLAASGAAAGSLRAVGDLGGSIGGSLIGGERSSAESSASSYSESSSSSYSQSSSASQSESSAGTRRGDLLIGLNL